MWIWVVHVSVLCNCTCLCKKPPSPPPDNDSERRNLIFQLDYEAKPPLKSWHIQHLRITYTCFQDIAASIVYNMARPSIRFFSFASAPCPLSTPRLTRLSLRPVRPATRTQGTYRPFGSAPSGVNSTPKYTPKSSSSTISVLLRPTSLILIFVPILTGFLGVWQLKRLRWKLDLIEEVDRNLHKEPMLLPGNIK